MQQQSSTTEAMICPPGGGFHLLLVHIHFLVLIIYCSGGQALCFGCKWDMKYKWNILISCFWQFVVQIHTLIIIWLCFDWLCTVFTFAVNQKWPFIYFALICHCLNQLFSFPTKFYWYKLFEEYCDFIRVSLTCNDSIYGPDDVIENDHSKCQYYAMLVSLVLWIVRTYSTNAIE